MNEFTQGALTLAIVGLLTGWWTMRGALLSVNLDRFLLGFLTFFLVGGAISALFGWERGMHAGQFGFGLVLAVTIRVLWLGDSLPKNLAAIRRHSSVQDLFSNPAGWELIRADGSSEFYDKRGQRIANPNESDSPNQPPPEDSNQ